MINFRRVVFPDPFGPIIACTSEGLIWISTTLRTFLPLAVAQRPSILRDFSFVIRSPTQRRYQQCEPHRFLHFSWLED